MLLMIARFRAQNSICRNRPMVYHSVIVLLPRSGRRGRTECEVPYG